MFEESLIESTTLLRSHARWPTLVSIAAQTVLVAALIALPLLHPEIVPLAPARMLALAPPPKPLTRPPVVRVQPVAATSPSATASPAPPSPALTAVRNLLTMTGHAIESPALAVSLGTGPMNPELPAATETFASGVTVAPVTKPTGRLRVSNGVTAGLLLAPIRPDYPAIAKVTHTEGTVVIQAVIAKDGHIEAAHVLSGPALLQASALEAVRSARYHPYLLNGEPTEVETTISIIFRMGS